MSRNPRLERTLDALDVIFGLKKEAKQSVTRIQRKAKVAIKEFSDSIDELFNDPSSTPPTGD